MKNVNEYADVTRILNMLLCTAVFAGLVWRLIGRWVISWPLAKWVVGLWAALEFIVALGIAARTAIGGPFNPIQFAIMVHCLVSLVVIAVWPRTSLGRPETRGVTK